MILHPSDETAGNTADIDDDADNLQANRQLTLWGYTNLGDPRFIWESDRFVVTQMSDNHSTKIGLLQECGSVSYEVDGYRFTKTVLLTPGASYPDKNCNLEIYTNSEMLELETLSGLVRLKSGESASHEEHWRLDQLN